MPYNQLLLSLIGGFLFVTRFNKTKFFVSRSSGQRLLLESALWGSLLLFVALLGLKAIALVPFARSVWRSIVPFNGLGAPALSLIGGFFLPYLANLFYRESLQNSSSYEMYSDYLGLLCFQAMQHKKQISLTLKNRKVYIGFVKGCNSAGRGDEHCSIFIQPSMSGYRKEESHELVINTYYTDIINKVLEPLKLEISKIGPRSGKHALGSLAFNRKLEKLEKKAEMELGRFNTAISLKEVVSAVAFEEEVYESFNPRLLLDKSMRSTV